VSAIVVIPWAKTDWTDSKRLAASAKLPLNDEGIAQAEEWGRQLADKNIQCLFASDELTSQETAKVVAQPSHARLKMLDGLVELDFGLWQGLTEETLRARFPKVYKRWVDDPTSVCPPEGEDLATASERIREAIQIATRKGGTGPVGVVLGPMVCAVARCELEARDLKFMRELLTSEPVWYDSVPDENGLTGESSDDGQRRRPEGNLGSV
jgi:probable phosphoglycerate mutase